MKKVLCILLSAVMVLSCLSLTAFAEETAASDLGIAVASDLHYNVPSEELETVIEGDDIYWYANRRAALEEESGFIIDEFLAQCAEDDSIEYVLIPGDLADNGKSVQQEHIDVAAKLKRFEETSGKDVFVVPGNHDYGVDCATNLDDFARIYADFGFDKAIETFEGTASYTADLGSKYRLIALDSCDPTVSTADGMSLKEIMWVCDQADKAYEDGRYPILMMHHNLLDHLPMQRIVSKNFIVRFHYTTATLFADHGIKVVFSGHEHCNDTTSYTTPAGNTIYDFATTSLSMYPIQYTVMQLTDDKITYNAKTITSIDTDALTSTVNGYTEEQIALMNEDFNAYAKGFLKAGVRYRLELSLSMEKMGIAEDAIYYNLVNTAVSGLTDILAMPLYGENSVQELAKEYNIDIPESDYETPWDLATELVAAHYAGEEAYNVDSTEVAILLRTVALILHSDLATVNDEVFISVVNSLLNSMGITSTATQDIRKLAAKVFGGVKPGEYFITLLISPLLYEFAFDGDAVPDNNGEFAGYNSDVTSFDNIMTSISNMFNKMLIYFENAFVVIGRMFGINR